MEKVKSHGFDQSDTDNAYKRFTEQNVCTVDRGLSNLIKRCRSKKPDSYFREQVGVALNLRDGRSFNPALGLFTSDLSGFEKPSAMFGVEIRLRGVISSRIWSAKLITDQAGQTSVEIGSFSLTSPGWEGNYFAKSLILKTHDVVNFAIDHFKDWGTAPVYAVISDGSRGTEYNRNGWTSHMALSLGYKNVEYKTFVKKYR